jgi:hypothetical protein
VLDLPKDSIELLLGTVRVSLAFEFSKIVLRRMPAGVEIRLGGDADKEGFELTGRKAIAAGEMAECRRDKGRITSIRL